MRSFKQFICEKGKEKSQDVYKKKHLLKHTVLIQAEDGDKERGSRPRINIKSLNDCNIIGYVTFNTFEDALSTFERLTNLDEIVEYLQRNSQRYPTCADWAYIVRDEVDTRDKLNPKPPMINPMGNDDEEAEDDEEGEEEPQEEVMRG